MFVFSQAIILISHAHLPICDSLFIFPITTTIFGCFIQRFPFATVIILEKKSLVYRDLFVISDNGWIFLQISKTTPILKRFIGSTNLSLSFAVASQPVSARVSLPATTGESAGEVSFVSAVWRYLCSASIVHVATRATPSDREGSLLVEFFPPASGVAQFRRPFSLPCSTGAESELVRSSLTS